MLDWIALSGKLCKGETVFGGGQELQSRPCSPGSQFLFMNSRTKGKWAVLPFTRQLLKINLLGTRLGFQTNKSFKIKSMFPWGFLVKVSSKIRIKMRLYPDESMSYFNCWLLSISQSVVEFFIPRFYLYSYHGVYKEQNILSVFMNNESLNAD